MKFVIVGRKHAFAVELQFPFSVARVQVTDSGDARDEISLDEDVNHPDYSGTVNAHLERRTDMEDAYGMGQIKLQQPHAFGFGHGSGK